MAEDEEGIWQVPEFMIAESIDPETLQLQKMFREELVQALDELPDNQRRVFIWNELEDMTLQQIAQREKENIKRSFPANDMRSNTCENDLTI